MFTRKRSHETDVHEPGEHTGHQNEVRTDPARDDFGGVNLGAAFFGWLVAVGLTVLLTGVLGAIAAGISQEADLSRSDAELSAGTIGLAAAIALAVVLAIGYYAGGYVAGRMSRYDGGRQGFAVWVFGLLVTLLAAALGWIFGEAYDVGGRVELPGIPIPQENLNLGALITGLVVLLVTLLAAMAGGKVGNRYHTKVDAARAM